MADIISGKQTITAGESVPISEVATGTIFALYAPVANPETIFIGNDGSNSAADGFPLPAGSVREIAAYSLSGIYVHGDNAASVIKWLRIA